MIFGSKTRLAKLKIWQLPRVGVFLGEIRIKNFKIIRENEDYIVATHDVVQDGKPRSNVMVYAEKAKGKFIYWKIQRAFEM